MKRNFYFQRCNGELICLGTNVEEKEAMMLMHQFLDSKEYKSFYTRVTEYPTYREYDVGSWSEFFYWGEPN